MKKQKKTNSDQKYLTTKMRGSMPMSLLLTATTNDN